MNVTGIIPESLLTPESIIAWLLEHPDVVFSDTESTASSVYDSDSDSVSEANSANPQLLSESVRLHTLYYCF